MGNYLSKWRHKPSTVEVLEKLVKDIDSLERCRQINLEQQKQIITQLILYSVALYVLFFVIFFFCYWPDEWIYRIVYSLPLLLFPFIVWLVKQFLHWYFVKRIRRNEEALEELKERKKTILNEVMETETYKKAKEILEKFSPELNAETILTNAATPTSTTGDLRHRNVGQTGKEAGVVSSSGAILEPRTPISSQLGGPLSPNPSNLSSTVRTDRPLSHRSQLPYRQNPSGTPALAMSHAIGPPPGPPMARPVLPRERSLMDRMVEYLLGDGPQNRYALICSECHSHNGMAIKEEFEYLSFRCCYCYAVNPARKQKPRAPPLETDQLHSSHKQQTAFAKSKRLQDKIIEDQNKESKEDIELVDKASNSDGGEVEPVET